MAFLYGFNAKLTIKNKKLDSFMSFKSVITQKEDQNIFLNRILFSSLLILLLASIIFIRLVFLQIYDSDQYKLRSLNNTIRTQSIPPSRGLIFDRNNNVLAENRPVFQLEMIPEQVRYIENTLNQLAELELININKIDALKEKIEKIDSRYQFKAITLNTKLSEKQIAIFANHRNIFKGIDIKTRLVRYYPKGEVFSHALGYVGSISSNDYLRFDSAIYTGKEQIGKTSIERDYETSLHGYPGKEKLLVNVRGRVMDRLDKEPFQAGNNLILTLDTKLQEIAYDAMQGKKGAVVGIDPSNGEILIFISTPAYDPNKISQGMSNSEYAAFQNNKNKPLFNRAIAGQYPPGSTIKPMLALGGLEMGYINPDNFISCEGHYFLPNYSRPFNDWDTHGSVNTKRAIQASCDVYFYELAVEMGIENMSSFLSNFNFGKKTLIDIGSEKKGIIPNRAWKKNNFKSKQNQSWFKGETVIAGIGQGYMLATPLQLAMATAMIANRGNAFQPHLVRAIENIQTGELNYTPIEEINNLEHIKENHWDIIHEGMIAVVNERRGTAYGIFQPNVPIAGKTGSSQVFSIDKSSNKDKEVPEELKDHGLFIGFAPLNTPKIALTVIIENGGGGRLAAAPVAEKIMTAILDSEMKNAL